MKLKFVAKFLVVQKQFVKLVFVPEHGPILDFDLAQSDEQLTVFAVL